MALSPPQVGLDRIAHRGPREIPNLVLPEVWLDLQAGSRLPQNDVRAVMLTRVSIRRTEENDRGTHG